MKEDREFDIACANALLNVCIKDLEEDRCIAVDTLKKIAGYLNKEKKEFSLSDCGFKEIHKQGFIV